MKIAEKPVCQVDKPVLKQVEETDFFEKPVCTAEVFWSWMSESPRPPAQHIEETAEKPICKPDKPESNKSDQLDQKESDQPERKVSIRWADLESGMLILIY